MYFPKPKPDEPEPDQLEPEKPDPCARLVSIGLAHHRRSSNVRMTGDARMTIQDLSRFGIFVA